MASKVNVQFNRKAFSLTTSGGASASLDDLRDRLTRAQELEAWGSVWQKLDLQENSCCAWDLGDFLSLIEKASFSQALQQIWHHSEDSAEIRLHLPHPRHDVFLLESEYLNPILPETLLQYDRSSKGSAFEITSTSFLFDPVWQEALDKNETTFDELESIARQGNNVVESFMQVLKVNKSAWEKMESSHISGGLLTPEIEKQLREQYQSAVARGDIQAAQTIQNFLKANGK